MSEAEKAKITRRKYLMYGGGVVIVAVVAAAGYGIYEATKPPAPVKKIVAGGHREMTGFLATYGYWNERGAQAAVKAINEAGGINGRPLDYPVEDIASDVAVANTKFRKLVLERGADFIQGSHHSGVAIAMAPIAKELRVPYSYIGHAYSVTPKSNRWLYRIKSSVRSDCNSFTPFALDLGKKWTVIFIDYEYGWSQRDEFVRTMGELGGTILDTIPIPLGTTDFVPYAAKIPKETEAFFYGMVGVTEAVGMLKQMRSIGFRQPILSFVWPFQGVNTDQYAEDFEGCYLCGIQPQNVADYDTPNHRKFRELVGMDENGADAGNPNNVDWGAALLAWEQMWVLKDAIEGSGWKSKADTPALIKWLEGQKFKESLAYPLGDWIIRDVDHHGFHDNYVAKYENGKLKLKWKIPYDKTFFPAEVDFTKEEL